MSAILILIALLISLRPWGRLLLHTIEKQKNIKDLVVLVMNLKHHHRTMT